MKYILLLLILTVSSLPVYGEVYDLERSIQTALENNESVKTAEKELEKSDHIYDEAFSGALPKVEANLTYLKNLYSSKVTNMEYYFAQLGNGMADMNNLIAGLHPEAGIPELQKSPLPSKETEAVKNNTLQAELSLIQPIWLGGKIGTAIDIAKVYKKMNRAAYRLEKDRAVTEIKKNFYQILALDESRRVMDMVKKDAYKNLDKIEKLYEEGLVSEYDLIQARVRVNSVEPKIVSINNYYELAKDYMKINMGLSSDAVLEIDGELSDSFMPDTTKVTQKALNNRIELLLLDYQRELLKKNIEIEYSNHLPSVIGLANYSFQSSSDDIADTFEKNSGVGAFNIGVTANLPVFNGFATSSKVDQARVEEKKASLNILKTKKLIRLQVKEALSKIDLARKELVLRDKEIAENEKALAITQVRYDNGLCTQLELTGAQTSLESARLNKVNTINNYINALIDLETATGIISLKEF
ncbi:MAG: TolC family protein [Candidatus Delongbacteria bacterium]